MKAIRLSFFQMLAYMRRDMMLFVACFAPILVGILFRFAIPLLEATLTDWLHISAIISPYYALMDIFFSMLSPTMFCFVSSMISLEEADERTAVCQGVFYQILYDANKAVLINEYIHIIIRNR